MSFSHKRSPGGSCDKTITPDSPSPTRVGDIKSPMTMHIENMKTLHIENMKKAFSVRRQQSRYKLRPSPNRQSSPRSKNNKSR